MKILGLSWGCNSSAALLADGKIVLAVSEERFTRRKNESVFPARAVEWIFQESGLFPKDLDAVAIASLEGDFEYILTGKYCNFSIQDHIREQREYWYPKFYKNANPNYLNIFKDKIVVDQYPSEYWKKEVTNPNLAWFHEGREELVAQFLGISRDKVKRVEHHRCHSGYGYYGSPFRGRPCLVLTLDAYGDGINLSVSRTEGKGIERLYSSSTFELGRLYKYMTLLLGMKPDEHEYKIMGLAPYAKPPVMKKAKEIFDSFQKVEGMDFKWVKKPRDLYYHFKEELEGCRFDGIAGALQLYLEEKLCEWITNVVREYKIKRIVLSGGVAMNIKASGKIAQLSEVEELFVCGSSSDDTLAIGACYSMMEDTLRMKNENEIERHLYPLGELFLGPEPGNMTAEIKEQCGKYDIVANPQYPDVIQLLTEGKVIARCIGRGEFGARALGNRSILADPRNPEIVRVINDKIKSRDFWMPFAPMVIDSYASKYLQNPKNIQSPHMTIGFHSTEEGRRGMPAALHPADFTARPEIVTPGEKNIYRLLCEFERVTGVGALLNTSFNLHGYPIVNSVKDALHVFENSDLDALWLEEYLIIKPKHLSK